MSGIHGSKKQRIEGGVICHLLPSVGFLCIFHFGYL